MSDREKIDWLAGTLLSSCANFAALMLILKRKGVLTEAEEREMYEEALLFLEVNQDPIRQQITSTKWRGK
ncbi:hypothetical protein [Brucella sp. BO2]|uniref:hypothetical protein n=1 Tax=Brucella sp. BO2 TaxID=693750 RepID=UPI0002FCDA91|nr:hypothetical protein [Brucella sp. BO2]